MKQRLTIFWSDEDDGFIAIDETRPGCSAFGTTEEKALHELWDAREAWDAARRPSGQTEQKG